MESYTVVKRSSIIIDDEMNHLGLDIEDSCGHRHKSREAAEKCLTRNLYGNICENCGNRRGTWECKEGHKFPVYADYYNASIAQLDSDGYWKPCREEIYG